MDIPNKWDASHFLTTLADMGLKQHITEATHKRGHTLDLLISRPEDSIIKNHQVRNILNSDHFVINADNLLTFVNLNHTLLFPTLVTIVILIMRHSQVILLSFLSCSHMMMILMSKLIIIIILLLMSLIVTVLV